MCVCFFYSIRKIKFSFVSMQYFYIHELYGAVCDGGAAVGFVFG